MNKLAIATVNFKNYKMTNEFLDSFEDQTDKNFKTFVVDVTPEKERPDFPGRDWFEIIYGQNKGYGCGINLGLKKAISQGFEKYVIINNDVEVRQDFVEKSKEALQKHPGSLIGGKIYYGKGYEYHKERYKRQDLGKVIWYAGGSIDWDHALIKHRGVDEVDEGKHDSFKETDFVTGCLMVLDKEVVDKLGFLDESYFLYYEDADFSALAKKKGVKLYYDPDIVIWHKNAQSTGGAGSKMHQTWQRKSRLKFGLRYAPWRTKIHLLKNYLLSSI